MPQFRIGFEIKCLRVASLYFSQESRKPGIQDSRVCAVVLAKSNTESIWTGMNTKITQTKPDMFCSQAKAFKKQHFPRTSLGFEQIGLTWDA